MIKILDIKEVSIDKILSRDVELPDVSAIVSEIIDEVKTNGDAALKEYALKFDGAGMDAIEVTAEERKAAWNEVDEEFKAILREAADNIRAFHTHQKRNSFVIADNPGIVLGQKVLPLERVGLYVPGGTASYPSSVLMNCIPAKIAGVSEIIMITPPMKNGKINPNILAAAEISGVDRVFKSGGAQAVAALAYGTETIPKVDKIVGPGNVFVAEAKKQVFGLVDIDMIAGPSEILVIADSTCDASFAAADMLSQAEHDKNAMSVMITDSKEFAERVAEEIERQLLCLPREETARVSIEDNGKIIIADSIEQMIDVANQIAPEHLELCVDQPFEYLDRIKNAGSIFLGKNSPEALGDYFAGTNHTLPTSGTARFSSPLSVDDFVKKSSFMYYSAKALDKVSDKIACFAEKEGLSAHARSVTVRTDSRKK